jgi:hypothetical protein
VEPLAELGARHFAGACRHTDPGWKADLGAWEVLALVVPVSAVIVQVKGYPAGSDRPVIALGVDNSGEPDPLEALEAACQPAVEAPGLMEQDLAAADGQKFQNRPAHVADRQVLASLSEEAALIDVRGHALSHDHETSVAASATVLGLLSHAPACCRTVWVA